MPLGDHWSCCGNTNRNADGCQDQETRLPEGISAAAVSSSPPQGEKADAVREVIEMALLAIQAKEERKIDVSVEQSWTAFKYFEGQYYPSFDKLLALVGLRAVKEQVLMIIKNVYFDTKFRPIESRVAKTAAYHFVLTGNPGTGKTTVSEYLSNIVKEIGLRPSDSKYYATTGSKLVEMGSKEVAALIGGLIPGILFVDEVHQLEPKSNKVGKGIMHSMMEPMESKRTEFTVIVAGYKKKVEEEFISADEGLKDRFKYYLHFDDYTEDELKAIFLTMLRDRPGWTLDNSDCADGRHKSLATVVARKVGKHANQDGFSNARAIRKALEMAEERCTSRLSSTPGATPKDWLTIKRIDICGNRIDLKSCVPFLELNALIGLDGVKRQIEDFIKLFNANYTNEWRGDKTRIFRLHRVFVGNPGSGMCMLYLESSE